MLTGRLNELEIDWLPGSSACVVLASEGYPGKARTGDKIDGLNTVSVDMSVMVFHSGTTFTKDETGEPLYATSGGRVLGVTATGQDLDSALNSAYSAVAKIHWAGMQYRRDIGK